MPHFAKS
jgi:hypothetical protein